MKTLILSKLAAISLIAVTGFASAGVINLKDSDSGTITTDLGAVTFAWDRYQPTGTGNLDPFLRIQNSGTEQGYNTSERPLDVKSDPFTRDVLISALVDHNSNGSYEFVLDVGEPGGNASSISLDGLKLYSSSSPGQSGNDVIGTLLWDLGADNSVLLDAKRGGGPGNGNSDMLMSVQTSIIDSAPVGEEYFILWSQFSSASSGFEEWSVITSISPVPEPSTIALFGLGLLGVMAATRRRKALESLQA